MRHKPEELDKLIDFVRQSEMGEVKTEKYIELDRVAEHIARGTAFMINELSDEIESEMPYKAQYVLEKVIESLKKRV